MVLIRHKLLSCKDFLFRYKWQHALRTEDKVVSLQVCCYKWKASQIWCERVMAGLTCPVGCQQWISSHLIFRPILSTNAITGMLLKDILERQRIKQRSKCLLWGHIWWALVEWRSLHSYLFRDLSSCSAAASSSLGLTGGSVWLKWNDW